MPLPTLLQAGFLLPQKWMTAAEAEKLKTHIPIDYIINFLSDRVPTSRGGKPKLQPKTPGEKVLVLKSSTGSGKSTTLPTSLYDNFIERTRKGIIVTQPRVLTCVDIPQSILQFAKNLEMDKNIGYNTGKFKRPPKEKGITFCTTEIVTQQFLTAKTPQEFMAKYQFIIIDEVHTRDLAIDRLLFLMKKLLAEFYQDPECPILILTSATFDETVFMDYFDVPRSNYIMVEGFAYPTTKNFPKYDISDYVKYAVKKAMQIHIDNVSDVTGDNASMYRDIMIFVPVSSMGEKMVLEFLQYNNNILGQEYSKVKAWKENELDAEIDHLYIKDGQVSGGVEVALTIPDAARFYVLPILLTSATFAAGGLEYQNMFSSIDTINLPIWKVQPGKPFDPTSKPYKFVKPSRRIIIGTNIAETGITIDTLKYCIDTGFEWHVEFNPDYGSILMAQKGCTQGMVVQRKGRVGRKSPGQWFPCFTEETFNSMQVDQYADIIMSNPADNVLTVVINETETKMLEDESTNKRRRSGSDIAAAPTILGDSFQKNYISDSTWWKIMATKKLNIGAMDFLEMPSGPSLQYAAERLHTLGMIDDAYDVTLFGYLANLIRFIPLECKRMIFGGFSSGAAILYLVTAAAFIQTGKRNLYDKKFKVPNYIGRPNFEFIHRILIGDEIIGAMLLFDMFNDWIAGKIKKLFKTPSDSWGENAQYVTTQEVRKWCEEHQIKYDGWISMISNRDVLLQNLVTLGIDVNYNTAGIPAGKFILRDVLMANLDEGLEEIRKIKEAIYGGYYINLCQWNERKRAYILLSHNIYMQVTSDVLPMINPAITKQTRPQFMITTDYIFSQSKRGVTFEFESGGFISVMDNYVSVDARLSLA